MTDPSIPDLARSMRETTDRTLAALDAVVRHLNARPDSPEAAMLEAQREIIFSLGQLCELVAGVGESQHDVLTPSQREAAIRQGVEEGFKEMKGELRRGARFRNWLLAAGMLVLGGGAVTAGFIVGSEHEFRTIMADCLRDDAQPTPGSGRVCAILMAPK